jgi:hypothetical protein
MSNMVLRVLRMLQYSWVASSPVIPTLFVTRANPSQRFCLNGAPNKESIIFDVDFQLIINR